MSICKVRRTLRLILIALSTLIATTAIAQSDRAPDIDLWRAAAEGNIAAIKQHVAAGTDLNAREPLAGNTPLILAAVYGQSDSVTALLAAGAELEVKNKEQITALYNAVLFGNPRITKSLVEKGADIYTTDKNGVPLIDFVSAPWSPPLEGIYRLLYGLLRLDLDVDKTRKFRASTARYLKALAKKRPRPANKNNSAAELSEAVMRDDANAIEELIANGANVDARDPRGNTPLQIAAVFGRVKPAKVLLDAKADINATSDQSGSALFNAAFFGHPEFVSLLLENGADPTIKREGATPLELVETPWSGDLETFYRTVYALMSQPPELERIKRQRPVVAKLLRDHDEKTPTAEMRTWKTADGKKTVKATFIKSDGTKVQLKRADGRTVTVPIEILRDEDKAYISEASQK